MQPIQENSQGLKWAKISGWGDLTHTLIEKNDDTQILTRPAQKQAPPNQIASESQPQIHIKYLTVNIKPTPNNQTTNTQTQTQTPTP